MKAMKIQKLITLILAIAALAAIALAIPSFLSMRSAAAEYASQSREINAQRSVVAAKQQELAAVDDSEAVEMERKASELAANISALQRATEAAEEHSRTLTADITEKQAEYEEVCGDEEYYETVKSALEAGRDYVLACLADD